ncbi:MAG TPA: hypothetical protein VFT45_22240 [Longimicrobium sp.]|nr:hypothetical protein [Longimicrobium sp.]
MAGCSRADAPGSRTLAACSVSQVDTTGWVRQTGPYRGYSFRIPPSFRTDTTGLFMHGGTMWRDGPRAFSQSNGYWRVASSRGSYAPEPPADPNYSECQDTVGGLRVFLSTRHEDGRYGAHAWFPDPRASQDFKGYETALDIRGTSQEDQALFLAIVRTVRPDSAR